MRVEATTVDEYLAKLDDNCRALISSVRTLILENINQGFEETIQYNMIGYVVPHSLYPAGYHVTPSDPLPFMSLGAQKNYCSLYAMSLYSDANSLEQFQSDWKRTGKKLNMGKSCIRFKKLDDLAVDVIANHLRAITVASYIASYEAALVAASKAKSQRSAKRSR